MRTPTAYEKQRRANVAARQAAKNDRAMLACPNCLRQHGTAKEVERCEMRWERSANDVRRWLYMGRTP